MHNFNKKMEEIQLLIDRLKEPFICNLDFNKYKYNKLLALSEQSGYPYGQAVAYLYLAGYYQMIQENEKYHLYIGMAKDIAEQKDYFDVMEGYFHLEGLQSTYVGDGMSAISFFMEGIKTAKGVNDRKYCAVLYNEIAGIFMTSGAYKDAEHFYIKALDELKDNPAKNVEYYRKTIYLNLLHLSCVWGREVKAEIYRQECRLIDCETGNLPLLSLEEEIRFLLLKKKNTEAEDRAADLRTALAESSIDAVGLQSVYIYFMELLLYIGNKENAQWCLEQIDKYYMRTHRNTAIQIQKLHIQYSEIFGIKNDKFYKTFYQTTIDCEYRNETSTAESIKNLIFLYETDKKKSKVTEECSDLQSAVNMDDLTKIYNRRYFSKLMSKMRQDDRIKSLGCIMIDVDFFKEYNDYYGHLKGDDVLKEVASILNEKLPDDAYAVRYGGDEFLCLFTDRKTEELTAYVQEVREELKQRNIVHVRSRDEKQLTLSCGICCETDLKNCDEQRLIQKADEALYQAKKAGRNGYVVYAERGNLL